MINIGLTKRFTIAKGGPGQTWYMIDRFWAWVCIIFTFIAGMTTGFALLAVILSFSMDI